MKLMKLYKTITVLSILCAIWNVTIGTLMVVRAIEHSSVFAAILGTVAIVLGGLILWNEWDDYRTRKGEAK